MDWSYYYCCYVCTLSFTALVPALVLAEHHRSSTSNRNLNLNFGKPEKRCISANQNISAHSSTPLSPQAHDNYPPASPSVVFVDTDKTTGMGQGLVRMMTYDRAANEKNVISVLQLSKHTTLQWFRLDDGVMGGQSESRPVATEDGTLHFTGTINTNGGGFASIRANLPESLLSEGIFLNHPAANTAEDVVAIRIRYRGDGKTYKLIVTDGNRNVGGPFSRTPSWQADLPTATLSYDDYEPIGTTGSSIQSWEEATIPLSSLLPNFGGGMRSRIPEEDKANYVLDPSSIRQVGLMLSLKLSNGQPNPVETFGCGIFPFSLRIHSIEVVRGTAPSCAN